MEVLKNLFKQNFRIIYEEHDIAYELNGNIRIVDEDEVDDTFYTFGIIPAKHCVMYSLILPAAAEENLEDVVKDFVSQKEPSDIPLKYDYAFIKEKGKLKVLISVLKMDDYKKYKENFYSVSRQLSGILPYQVLMVAEAINAAIFEGIVVYKIDGIIYAMYIKNSFPLAFLKVRELKGVSIEQVVERFKSSERIEDDITVYYMGSCFQDMEKSEHKVIIKEDINLIESFHFLIATKVIPIVNHLPPKERKVIRRWWKYALFGIVVLGVLIYSLSFLSSYLSLKREVAGLQYNFNARKKQAIELRKRLGNVDELQGKANYFRQLEKNKKKMLILLEELTKKVPKDAYLTRVSINERGDLEINGKAKDVFKLIKSLNSSRYFKSVEKKSSRDAGEYTIFIIRGKIVY